MAFKTLNISIKGVSAMLTHNGSLCDPMNPITQSLKKISSKRTKAERDFLLMSQLELLGGVYPEHDLTVANDDFGYEVTDEDVMLTGDWGNCTIPDYVVEATIVNGAKKKKKGPKFKAGMRVLNSPIILVNEKPLNVSEVLTNRKYKLISKVAIGTSSIMRTRPLFPNWQVNFDCLIDDEVLDAEDLKGAIEDAGKLVGVGDWRPRFGTFTLEEIKVV
jgi:hypothetical protein